jgi:hypothetical protein
MRRFLVITLWVIWIAFVSIIVIVMEAITSPYDMPPKSSIMEFMGSYRSQTISPNGDVSLMAWALERVLPVHLMGYLAWRGFKAVFLR